MVRTIELATIVVREKDAVNTEVSESLRVLKVLCAFDDDFARLHVADDLQVVIVDRRVVGVVAQSGGVCILTSPLSSTSTTFYLILVCYLTFFATERHAGDTSRSPCRAHPARRYPR
jgi:hypothetical protein